MEPLVRYDAQGRLQPALASSFSIPNPTTYVYNLRKGVKFWDGTPLTTADVIYSLQRSASKEGGSELATFFGSVASMKATGPSQVTIKLKGARPLLPLRARGDSDRREGVLVGAPEGHRDAGRMNMGTGPFRFTKFARDQGARSSQFDGYWGQSRRSKNVSIKLIVRGDAAARGASGRGRRHVPGRRRTRSASRSGSPTTTSRSRPRSAGLLLARREDPPFNDIHVRRAIA